MLFPLGIDKTKMFAITTYIQHYIGGSNKFSDKRQQKALCLEKEKYSQMT